MVMEKFIKKMQKHILSLIFKYVHSKPIKLENHQSKFDKAKLPVELETQSGYKIKICSDKRVHFNWK